MKKSIVLAAAVTSVIAGLALSTSSNAQSPMSDEAYCKSLVKTLRDVGLGRGRGGLAVSNAAAVAIAQCDEGEPGPAIPVLERQLRDRDIAVPRRS